MDSIFLLPLACLALLQLLVALPVLLLQPLWKPGSVSCAQYVCKTWTNNASKSVILTIVVALSGLLLSSLLELMRVHTHEASNLYERGIRGSRLWQHEASQLLNSTTQL